MIAEKTGGPDGLPAMPANVNQLSADQSKIAGWDSLWEWCCANGLPEHSLTNPEKFKDLGGPRLIAQWIKDLAEEPSAGENELLERIRELEGVLVDLILIGEAVKQGKSSGLDTLEVWTMAKSLIPLERIKARFDEIASR